MVCASRFVEVRERAQELLCSLPALRIYSSEDLIGVEMSSTLARAYTIVLGMADSIGVGVGTRAVLLTRIIAEGTRLARQVGAGEQTFSGLAGLGNLLVRGHPETQDSDYLRGRSLVETGPELSGRCDGVMAAQACARMASRLGVRAPVLLGLQAVLSGHIGPNEAAKMISESGTGAE
jgi:glycerol-3-phosphate dehydrogenase (NAD(P)+)